MIYFFTRNKTHTVYAFDTLESAKSLKPKTSSMGNFLHHIGNLFERLVMSGLKVKTLLILFTLFVGACGAPQEAESLLQEDSGIRGPAYSAIVSAIKSLGQTHSVVAQTISYGQTMGGREMIAIKIAKNMTSTTQRPGVLITGSIHGNEFLNIENNLPEWFLKNRDTSPGLKKFLDNNGVILVVPIYNPDGYDERKRENNNGIDLNRDYDGPTEGVTKFKEQESKNFKTMLANQVQQSNIKLKMTFDYHCCIGAIIYPWGHKTARLPSPALEAHKTRASLMIKHFASSNYKVGQLYDVLNYTASGASMDYFYDTYGSTALVLEGAKGTETQKFNNHTAMWDEALGVIADEMPSTGGGGTGGGTSGNDNPLFMALSRDYGSGKLMAKVSASRATTMALCAGVKDVCLDASKAPIAVSYATKTTVGDREIFTSDQSFSVNPTSSVFTILAYDPDKKVIGSQQVTITKKGAMLTVDHSGKAH